MTIRTRVGFALDGDYAHFGHRTQRDLLGRESFLSLTVSP